MQHVLRTGARLIARPHAQRNCVRSWLRSQSTTTPKTAMGQHSVTSEGYSVTYARDTASITWMIHPSFPKAADKVCRNLPLLLSAGWEVDESGIAVHRSVLLSETGREALEREVMRVADEEDHHPHLDWVETGGKMWLTVTCTTHSPLGLSMRDIRLARKIDGLLEGVHIERSGGSSQEVQMQVEQGRKRNMEAAQTARESCGCGH